MQIRNMIVVLAILISNIHLSSTTSCYCTARDYVIPVFSENNETEYTPGILMKNECFAGRIQGDLFCPDNQPFCLNQENLYASPCAQVSPGYLYILPLFNATEYEEELLAIHYEENENRKRFLLQDDDREWGQWEQWQECIAIGCGENGIRTRNRKCLLQPDGKCPGDNFQLEPCFKNCLQLNDKDYWSDWSEWSSCVEPCDSIMSNRTRDCNAKSSTCVGDGLEEKPCKVDGSWSEWTSWSECSFNYTTDNGGLTHRLRKCDSPAPACGGEQCNGTSWNITTCAEIHGWTEWTEWSDCIPVAGDELKLRERKCKDDTCVGENFEYELCKNKTFIIWTTWNPCSATCGNGMRSRKGYCLTREEIKDDLLPETKSTCINETESCIKYICEGSGMSPWSEWTSWSPCDPPCDDGKSTRTRQCLNRTGCQEPSVETTNCSLSLCKIDGDWSPWEEWSQCRFIQDNNFIVRFRSCTDPPPKNSGKNCSGNYYEIDACKDESAWGEWVSYGQCIKTSDGDTTGLQYRNRTCHTGLNKEPCQGNHEETIKCSLQGKWSRWGNWSACSQTCGQGLKQRYRSCVNASDLECAGSNMENMTCVEVQNCPVDGSFTEWTVWSQCHVTCGGGPISRNRYCDNPKPQYGGKPCEGPLTEASVCNTQSCPVDGHWTDWTEWKPCSVTCGNGTKIRERTCSNPLPKYGGKACEGHGTDSDTCNEVKCDVDGEWGLWEAWTQCTCDNNHTRTRYCDNPKPVSNGAKCQGDATQTDLCSPDTSLMCPVNGKWTEWSQWGSVCSVTCGKGIVSRTRNCSNPAPQYGGAPCPGEHSESKECDTIICPTDGGWSSWSAWTPCSVTCENGTQSRNRSCNMPKPENGGQDCQGYPSDTTFCSQKFCPVDGMWSEWEPWASWDVTCARGSRRRHRKCDNPPPSHGGHDCPGDRNDFDSKDLVNCPVDGAWSEWSEWFGCTKTCGGGTNSRYRACDNPKPAYHGTPCPPQDFKETKNCHLQGCPVDGGWTEWGSWSACSVTCDNGTITKTRNCTNPQPQNGGHQCSGNSEESNACYQDHCPVNGAWTSWYAWNPCSVTCGDGIKTRQRSCNNPAPQYSGLPCFGISTNNDTCNERPCAVDGNWGLWLEWERCSASCGDGTRLRRRQCDNPKPDYGGTNCTGTNVDTGPCNRGPCPVDGSWGQWGQWSTCSGECPDGSKIRVRHCDNPEPLYGGDLCKGMSNETGVCLPQSCIVDGGWGSWLSWESCSKTCGDGVAVRHRPCDNPPPQYGGANCSGTNENSGSCNIGPCPVDGAWGGWERWSDCKGGCPNGTKKRFRSCDSPTPVNGGEFCKGMAYEIAVCRPLSCTVDGGWGSWLSWETCSKTCGDGVAVRHRLCDNPPPQYGGANCSGTIESSGSCNIAPCPVDGIWGAWLNWSRCTGTCPTGNKKRFRSCDRPTPENGGAFCVGQGAESMGCMPLNCTTSKPTAIPTTPEGAQVVDGEWSAWSPWFGCSVTCGPGTDTRYRACNNPTPENGGKYCQGSFRDTSSCNQGSCLVDGQWSSWSVWFGCSATCGQGTDHRYRACNNPKPQNGGSYCHGSYSETTACNDAPCIVDGGWSDWGAWGVCSVTCSNGTSLRRRTCDNPEPKYGGKQCAGNSTEVTGCFLRLCPVDGNWGSWTPWSRCMGNCTTAIKERFRNCDHPLPQNKGKTCEGPPFEMIPCIQPTCATAVLTDAEARNGRNTTPYWSPWFYDECSVTCGSGTTRRLRHCSTGNDKDCRGPAVEILACNKRNCPS